MECRAPHTDRWNPVHQEPGETPGGDRQHADTTDSGFLPHDRRTICPQQGNRRATGNQKKQGEPPLVRPVNVGCCILKWALQVVAREPGTRQAAEGLGPIQRGLGQKRGVEACAHLIRALHIKGYTVALNDFKNGFNDFHRQAMMDAVQRECLACTNLMHYYYASTLLHGRRQNKVC